MAEMNPKKRNQLPKSAFALPKERAYPIQDINHARNALARVSQHGTPEEQKKVARAIKKKFPALAERSAFVKDVMKKKEVGEAMFWLGLSLGIVLGVGASTVFIVWWMRGLKKSL